MLLRHLHRGPATDPVILASALLLVAGATSADPLVKHEGNAVPYSQGWTLSRSGATVGAIGGGRHGDDAYG